MIILDTNVLSEPLRRSPDTNVVRWLDAQSVETLWLTSITVAEIRYGIAALPEGRRKSYLSGRIEDDVLPMFEGRVLGFGVDETAAYAELRAAARAAGAAVGDLDAMIAAIAVTRSASIATRDTAPFLAAGIPVTDPFVAVD